jgi:hypothetical protein
VWNAMEPPVLGALEPEPELEIEEEPELAPVVELVNIAPAPAPEPEAAPEPFPDADHQKKKPVSLWETLSSEDQQIHLRAQRFARVQVAEMRLYEADAVQAGRRRGDLYDALRKPIEAARETYREQFFSRCESMVDYLHLELIRTLAHDDPDLCGKDYPGPLV